MTQKQDWNQIFGEISEKIDAAGYEYHRDGSFYPIDKHDESKPMFQPENMADHIGYPGQLLDKWRRWVEEANGWNDPLP